MSTTTFSQPNRGTPARSLQAELIAFLFFLLGIGVIVGLAALIASDPELSESGISIGDRLWLYLREFGIVQPILIITGGVLLLRLSVWLRSRHIGAARWARIVLFWLLFLAVLGFLNTVRNNLNLETTIGEGAGANFIPNVLPWFGAVLLLAGGLVFLNRSMRFFGGEEYIRGQRTRQAWNLLAPTLIIFLLIGIGPLEQVFITSLTNERFASSETVEFVGLNNYARLLGLRLDTLPCEGENCPSARRYLTDNISNYGDLDYRPYQEFELLGTRYVISARDREFMEALVTSTIYTVVGIGLQLVIGMAMAMILTARMRGMGLLRVALLVPLAIPTLIATQFWDVMLLPNDAGVANSFLMSVGLINEPQRWLLDDSLQLPAVILVIVWKETPSMALLLLPGLLSISPEIYQAASVDGANRWQRFWRITLPMMRTTIGVALVLRTMVMLRVFDVFEILLGQRRFSLSTYTYDVLLQRQELGYSSTISVAIFAIILVFTIIYMRSLRIDQA